MKWAIERKRTANQDGPCFVVGPPPTHLASTARAEINVSVGIRGNSGSGGLEVARMLVVCTEYSR